MLAEAGVLPGHSGTRSDVRAFSISNTPLELRVGPAVHGFPDARGPRGSFARLNFLASRGVTVTVAIAGLEPTPCATSVPIARAMSALTLGSRW